MPSERHLAAIMFTDIVGYTALMGRDEQKAYEILQLNRQIHVRFIERYHGTLIKELGDGMLLRFSTVTDAINAAMDIQKACSLPGGHPLTIGIHHGEILVENNDVFGDTVNIASRIQTLGVAGSILFSGKVKEEIQNRPEFQVSLLGKFHFKNVQHPMDVFAISNDGFPVPKAAKKNAKLEKKSGLRSYILATLFIIPAGVILFFVYSSFGTRQVKENSDKSIAVLPFLNMSNDPQQDYFSDGMTEEIITQLAKIKSLKVIGRTSSMFYKNSKTSIRQIAEELGVATILEGSVQTYGDKVKITAQLIDAKTQEHIWADRYDRKFEDVFIIQNEVAQQIASQLNANLTDREITSLGTAPTNNPEAYQYYLQAKQVHDKFLQTIKPEYFDNCKSLFEKALELDSNYALAHAGLADLYDTYINFVTKDSTLAILADKEINKAYSLAPEHDYVNSVRGLIFQRTPGKLDEAYNSFKKSYEINPNNPATLYGFAMLLSQLGLIDERIILLKKAAMLDPLNAIFFGFLGGADLHLNRLDEGLKNLQTAARLEPDMFYVLDRIAYAYSLQNNLTEAKKWITKFELHEIKDKLPEFNSEFGEYAAYYYAKSGNKKRALELSRHWRVLLALGMKDEALKDLLVNEPNYLMLKGHLPHEDFNIVRNDPRFLQLLEKTRIKYEEAKKKYSLGLPED